MTTPCVIVDPKTNNAASVTKFGQLIIAPANYSDPVEREMNVVGAVFNFIPPRQDKSIVITGIIASASNDVSNNDPADVRVFESDSATSSNILAGIVRPQLLRSNNLPLTGLNLLVPEGRWVNATTTDNTILLTVLFYYVPVTGT